MAETEKQKIALRIWNEEFTDKYRDKKNDMHTLLQYISYASFSEFEREFGYRPEQLIPTWIGDEDSGRTLYYCTDFRAMDESHELKSDFITSDIIYVNTDNVHAKLRDWGFIVELIDMYVKRENNRIIESLEQVIKQERRK